MKRSKLDPNQITQAEHDEQSNARRVKLVSTEFNVNLDHADGDSVTTHPAKLVVKVEGVEASDAGKEIIPAMYCSSLRKLDVRVNGSGSVEVLLSPEDKGDFFYKASKSDLDNLCARRVKVVSINAEGDVHLVGRS